MVMMVDNSLLGRPGDGGGGSSNSKLVMVLWYHGSETSGAGQGRYRRCHVRNGQICDCAVATATTTTAGGRRRYGSIFSHWHGHEYTQERCTVQQVKLIFLF